MVKHFLYNLERTLRLLAFILKLFFMTFSYDKKRISTKSNFKIFFRFCVKIILETKMGKLRV